MTKKELRFLDHLLENDAYEQIALSYQGQSMKNLLYANKHRLETPRQELIIYPYQTHTASSSYRYAVFQLPAIEFKGNYSPLEQDIRTDSLETTVKTYKKLFSNIVLHPSIERSISGPRERFSWNLYQFIGDPAAYQNSNFINER